MLVTANTILAASYLWKVYYVTVDPWFKTRSQKSSAGRYVNLRLDELHIWYNSSEMDTGALDRGLTATLAGTDHDAVTHLQKDV